VIARALGLRVALGAALLALAAGASSPRAEEAVRSVETVGFPVADLARSVAFFTEVLAFERVGEEGPPDAEGARAVRLRLGEETIELEEFAAGPGLPIPAGMRSNDLAFQHLAVVVSDMERAYAVLRRHHVQHVSPGPQRLPDWNPNAGGIEAFYFRDPDGHALELIHFPEGKGDPRWQRKTDRLFLGIDHTAIAVADTEASLRFYRDTLGLRVAGESENYGAEQERLNGVFGARLRITALRARHGMGIELLEYLAPPGGAPRPADLRPNDLLAWRTTLARDATSPPSPAPARLAGDPDGHVLRFVASSPEEEIR
jgi:catechol 2,3-dioxygenase-like lactoylglutathione lyase family enzyme